LKQAEKEGLGLIVSVVTYCDAGAPVISSRSLQKSVASHPSRFLHGTPTSTGFSFDVGSLRYEGDAEISCKTTAKNLVPLGLFSQLVIEMSQHQFKGR
jgi:hypothetical protein